MRFGRELRHQVGRLRSDLGLRCLKQAAGLPQLLLARWILGLSHFTAALRSPLLQFVPSVSRRIVLRVQLEHTAWVSAHRIPSRNVELHLALTLLQRTKVKARKRRNAAATGTLPAQHSRARSYRATQHGERPDEAGLW